MVTERPEDPDPSLGYNHVMCCLRAEKSSRNLKRQIKFTLHLLLSEKWRSNFSFSPENIWRRA